ncbi:MAG TPA: 2-hydroxyacyl-CoA dehydratase [Ktedonobacteraceae bacterium]|nr:2-hydroxyacyl-CoA dehydratase [Ktedonobacteraceae bacterium]
MLNDIEVSTGGIDTATTLMAVLERCFALAMHTGVANDEQPGVIGYFPVYFPEEIVHAAGLRPHALLGGGNKLEMRLADARIGSFVCSICRSTTEQGLNGTLRGMQGFFTQPICDAAKHMAGIWGRNFPAQPSQILALPQNVNSAASGRYVYDEYQRLRGVLAAQLGHDIPDEAIRTSLRVYNENRRLQRELYRIRRDDPARLSTVETYLLVRAGTRIRREEHNVLLRDALRLLAERPVRPRDKPRVIFLGGFCEQPPLEMIETIEDACFIVDDDLLIGQRWITADIAADDGDPVWALAESYIEHAASSPVQYDARKPKEEMLMRMLKDARAEAAIITAAKFCEPGLDDQLALSHRLDAENIPYLVLEFEEKMTSFEQMAMQVETFAESLLFH